MEEDQAKIDCPIFQKQEPIIKDITDSINKAKRIIEKAEFAEELQKEVEIFLSCSDYDAESLDCKNCRCVADLRMLTTNLILKAKKLGK